MHIERQLKAVVMGRRIRRAEAVGTLGIGMQMDDRTAWHEAGHAVVATLLGGVVRRITIEPDEDDRYGNTEVAWPMNVCTQEQHAMREIRTLIAGSIVENIFTGEEDVFAVKVESSNDWLKAMQLVRGIESSQKKQSHLLAVAAREIQELVAEENVWAAIGALADELEAHETLESETVREVLGFWLNRIT